MQFRLEQNIPFPVPDSKEKVFFVSKIQLRAGDKLMDTMIDSPTVDGETAVQIINRMIRKFEHETVAHWELEKEPNGKPYCFHCSHCDSDWSIIDIKSAYEYCPNCGARMTTEWLKVWRNEVQHEHRTEEDGL